MLNHYIPTPVDGALYMLERGLQVFPLKAESKKPAFPGWQEWAGKATRKSVKDYGTAQPLANWGVHCGPTGYVAIDVDNKEGRPGLANLASLMQKYGLPDTLTVETTTGGLHIYYKGVTANTNDVLAKGIETRCEGQFVVAPGSRIGGLVYTLKSTSRIAPLPEWVHARVDERKEPLVLQENQVINEGERVNTLVSFAGTMRARGMGYEAILAALYAVNDNQTSEPIPESKILDIARSVARYAPDVAQDAAEFIEPPKWEVISWSDINLSEIKKRDWIMRNRYIAGFISLLVAPGGLGKSTLAALDAVAVATGHPLTGFNVERPGAVWIYNTEDPLDEIKRKAAAIALQHNLDMKHLSNIYSSSGRDKPFVLAKYTKNGVVINGKAIQEAISFIQEKSIALMIVDPFVRSHEVSENENMQVDKVAWCFQHIADKTNCAVCLVHHTNKGALNPGNTEQSMNSVRGATSLVNAARVAHTLTVMSEKEAGKYGVAAEKRRWYMRLDNVKANLQAPAERADWYEKISIDLFNGDTVGTIKPINLSDVKAERKKEAQEVEKRDFIDFLDENISPGEVYPLKVLRDIMLENPDYEHLFPGLKTERRTIPRMIYLLGLGLSTSAKVFRYKPEPDKRVKHWVFCYEKRESKGV